MKALVIEDSLTSMAVICYQLRRVGVEPLTARDSAAGIEVFKTQRPDLIIIDALLPGVDGFETAKRIRQLERDGEWTPILFLLARASDDDLERAIAVGGDDYLVKPISEIVLTSKVRAMQRIAQMRYSLVVLTRRLDEANRELLRLSTTDSLTGIPNRRLFDDFFKREWARAVRAAVPLSVLMCDVDSFKQYNDEYGHPAGDECLRAVASVLSDRVRRPADLVARYGGEEFVVVLPETELQGALLVAEDMRRSLEDERLPHRHTASGLVTISIGAACVVPRRGAGKPEELVARADMALYRAKQEGRNRVSFSGTESE